MGISIETFWDLSYGEVIDLIESRSRVNRQEIKDKIARDFELAGLIGIHVYKMMDKDVKIPNTWDWYPGLFEEEKKQYEASQNKTGMELYKAKMVDFALSHNSRFKE